MSAKKAFVRAANFFTSQCPCGRNKTIANFTSLSSLSLIVSLVAEREREGDFYTFGFLSDIYHQKIIDIFL